MTGRRLADELEALDGSPERGREVTGLAKGEGGVTVTVAPVPEDGEPVGSEERLRCRHLVDADGVEGTARKALGLDYATTAFPSRSNPRIDARLSWRRPTEPDEMWFLT